MSHGLKFRSFESPHPPAIKTLATHTSRLRTPSPRRFPSRPPLRRLHPSRRSPRGLHHAASLPRESSPPPRVPPLDDAAYLSDQAPPPSVVSSVQPRCPPPDPVPTSPRALHVARCLQEARPTHKVPIPCSSFCAVGFDCKEVSNKLSKKASIRVFCVIYLLLFFL
jgi:hypothetical protein